MPLASPAASQRSQTALVSSRFTGPFRRTSTGVETTGGSPDASSLVRRARRARRGAREVGHGGDGQGDGAGRRVGGGGRGGAWGGGGGDGGPQRRGPGKMAPEEERVADDFIHHVADERGDSLLRERHR